MKKIIYLFLIMTIIFVNCGCENNMQDELEDTVIHVTSEKDVIPKYVDDNPITIGLYKRDNTGYHYIKDEIYLPWNQFVDIITFKVLPTNQEYINSWYMQDTFPTYWNKYENINDYKIGFNLSYETDEGEFSWNIINPNDRMYPVFNYVQLYVYDDVTPSKGAWYDHLDDHEVTDGVLFTSIKLCASVFIDKITSPMKLTVFTYNDSDDFDPDTGLYRGNSYHTIYIYRAN